MASILGDSACTDTIIRQADQTYLTDLRPCTSMKVQLPNGDVITSTNQGTLKSPAGFTLPAHTFASHELNQSLLALSDFANQGATITLTATSIVITDQQGKLVVHAPKDLHDKLWRIPFSSLTTQPLPTTTPSVSAVITHQYMADKVNWFHRCMGSPTIFTFIRAFTRGWIHYEDLTPAHIRGNTPVSTATAKGHLTLQRQGVRSTKHSPTNLGMPPLAHDDDDDNEDEDDINKPSVSSQEPSQLLYIYIKTVNFSDLTGKLPVQSLQGNHYVLVSVYGNYVKGVPMPNRTTESYIAALTTTLDFYAAHGHKVTVQRLDNETSAELEAFLADRGITIEYVPPYDHRANRAEDAIKAYKDHFIATMAGTSPDFPMHLWESTEDHRELTLNLMRRSATDPLVSAYEAMHGHKYDFEAHPLAPIGTKVLVLDSADKRPSWAPHGTKGFIVGPALHHYRCWKAYIPETRAFRVTNSVAWLPDPLAMPGSSPLEITCRAIKELTSALATLAKSVDQIDLDIQQPLRRHASALKDSLEQFADILSPSPSPAANQQQSVSEQRVNIPVTPSVPTGPASVPAMEEQRASEMTIQPRVLSTSTNQRVAHPELVTADYESDTDDDPSPGVEVDSDDDPDQSPVLQQPSIPSTSTRSGRTVTPPRWYTTASLKMKKKKKKGGDRNRTLPTTMAVVNHVLNLTPSGQPLTFRLAISGKDSAQWLAADDDEFVRLIDTTGTMKPIKFSDIPRDRLKDITPYVRAVREKMKEGELQQRVRGTAANNRNYIGRTDAENIDLPVIKMLLLDVVSQRKLGKPGICKCFDIENFYLNTPLDQDEYVRIPIKTISQHIIDKYNLSSFAHNGSVYFKVTQAMYGLQQAGHLSWNRLVKVCEDGGFTQTSPEVPGLYVHSSNGSKFALSTDDFLAHFPSIEAEQHFCAMLAKHYKYTVDHTASKYLGINIDFDDIAHTVTLSLPSYVPDMLHRFYGSTPPRPANSPAVYEPPSKGPTSQQVKLDLTPLVSEDQRTCLQQKIGCILYLARAVDNSVLEAVNHAASMTSAPTQTTVDQVERIMSYLVQYPNPKLILHACDMILHSQTDASYLTRPKARSVCGGLHFLGNRNNPDLVNGPIICISSIIPTVCASAAEAEYAACFLNGQIIIWLRAILAVLGYPQDSPTRMRCDNQCAVGLANNTVKPKRSKAIDMRYHWIRDKVKNSCIDVYWWPGVENLADFFTKALPVHNFEELKPNFVHSIRVSHQSKFVKQ